MNKILLIRHAQTDTAGKRLTGRSAGVFLNAEGREQARELPYRISGIKIDYICCSPLERTVETASQIAEKQELELSNSDSFLEIDYGKWTNLTVQELRGDPLFDRYNAYRSNTRIPGGETMNEVQTRTVTGIGKLCMAHPGATIAIVTHSDVIKLAILWYIGIPVDMMHRIEITPASVSVLELSDEIARLIKMNDTGILKL